MQIKDWISKRPQLTQRQRRLVQAGLVGLAVAAVICLAQWAGLFTSIRLAMVDYLYETDGDPGDDILIVAIDEASQQALGDWPWAFDPYIRLLERLEGARAVGFDVLLPNPGPEGNPDTPALLEATRQTGNVILPLATLQLNQHSSGELYSADLPIRPFPALLEASVGAGTVAVYPDRDGTLRRVPLLVDAGGGETWEAFSLQVLRLYLGLGDTLAFLEGDRVLIGDESGITYDVRTDANAAMFVNFVGQPNTFPTYSFIDVIEDRVAYDMFENRIVLVGMINTLSEMDLHQTPVSTGRMAGIEFQANAIHTLLHHRPLVQVSEVEKALTVVVLALFSALVLSQLEAVPGAIFTLLLAVGYFIFTSIRFDGGHLPDVLFPYATIFVNYAALSATRFASEQVGRRRVSDIFGRFVSADVRDIIVDMALEDPELIQPGGRQMDISVLFADIRGFTTLSENLPPSEVVEILNQYLESMGEQIFAHGGTLDKYTGDGMMVLFGAPLEQQDHAERAVRAALAMQRAAAEVSHARGDVEWDMVYGIGITTGPAVVGHIGSKRRLDYTAIGDTVNLAARLEGKAPPGAIFISQATYDAVRHIALVEALEPMMVKGKAKPVVVYQVLGLRDEASPVPGIIENTE